MEQSTNLLCVKCDFASKSNESKKLNARSAEFSNRFDSNQDASDSDQNECVCNSDKAAVMTTSTAAAASTIILTSTELSSLNAEESINYLDDFNSKIAIVSPDNELLLKDVVCTELVATCNELGRCN